MCCSNVPRPMLLYTAHLLMAAALRHSEVVPSSVLHCAALHVTFSPSLFAPQGWRALPIAASGAGL